MALCSQAFTSNNKRSCTFNSPYHQAPAPKRICLSDIASYKYPTKKSVCIYTSSEEDNDSEDEQSCYNADQIRAKRRASTRVSFSLNSELSRAISQYSDEDEELVAEDDNEVNVNTVSTPAKHYIPATDKSARSRCFEYLVGAIDEAWARYCDAATNVEDEVYGYNTPASVATDDEEYFDNTTDITDYDESDFDDGKGPKHTVQSFRPRLSSSASCSSLNSTKEDPSSCQLQALKDRLTKAKYYLQDLVDSDVMSDVNSFWKRWDMIKYATIELVEDDDDDEIVETTIDELESGRLFAH
ncbi:uncharacterized protein CANTADRAFT_69378 [Suhomyces tanzawaensis NRRL Y-17324]|uniref:Uncharacterized protein n=1 Tax=Suhomyces tanzawaensis NRRL Y-17324 TaxID=984487 RepID=A0A1E4SEN8_9ASCO|nr:uncharacterized protein CANTADRAFT_69378 [Suhomyces tanzawaensis NRRL Y-17324]ODV77984.1 hypothetical protein CANTADRAFT_69378 [Suhomyces tanzawaensis NRRL Y-17324]